LLDESVDDEGQAITLDCPLEGSSGEERGNYTAAWRSKDS
jgi:hypothetical protein